MFGRKREAELENRLIEYKTMTKSVGVELKYHLEQMNSELSGINTDTGKLKEQDENINRELAFAEAKVNELLKDIEKKEEELSKKEEFSSRMRQALGEKGSFDADMIIRNADKIADEIRTNDRKVNNAMEEIRAMELISTKMKDIAGQTSALSLNAAIMGARIDSGEEGFVQTATEIKELAAEYSKVITELNRRLEKITGIVGDISTSNSEMRSLASEGCTAANDFSAKYDELYKDFGTKPWESEDKKTDFESSKDSIAAIKKSIADAVKLGEEAIASADELSRRMKDYSHNNSKAEEMVAKIDNM